MHIKTKYISMALPAILSLILLFIPVKSTLAAPDIDLYDVTMKVVDESKSVRTRAFARGLEEVFIRLSGDSIISSRLKMPSPGSYVKQYSYQLIETPEVTSDGELLSTQLTVQYNGTRMINYLRKNAFSVWGEYRPKLVVWLAVRDGSREYVLKNTDQSLIKSATDGALKRRGVPSRWPLYDKTDKSLLSFSDIRGGFREYLEKASRRYGRGPVLSGSLSWSGSLWQSDWTLLLDDGEYRWNHKNASYTVLIDESINQIVDTMAKTYAVRDLAPEERGDAIYLNVSNIHNIPQYKQVYDYLSSVPAVNTVGITAVDSDRVVFVLSLRSSQHDFLSLLNNDDELQQIDDGTGTDGTGTEIKLTPAPVVIEEPLDLEALQASQQAAKNPDVSVTNLQLVDSALNNVQDTENLELPTVPTPSTYYFKRLK